MVEPGTEIIASSIRVTSRPEMPFLVVLTPNMADVYPEANDLMAAVIAFAC